MTSTDVLYMVGVISITMGVSLVDKPTALVVLGAILCSTSIVAAYYNAK